MSSVLTLSACHSSRPEPASVVNAADEATAGQLYAGFYAIEQHLWRWASKNFAVMLKPPAGSEQRGATVELKLFIPENHIQELGPITVSADAAGYILEPETFSSSGGFTYSRDIPACELDTNILPLHFFVDKSMPGVGGDSRDLAVVINSVALRAK